MGHNHSHTQRNLGLTVVLNVIITTAQFIGGFISGSLALISDAIHNLSDVIAVLLAFIAHKISHKPAGSKSTFGFKRAEILAALLNALVLIVISVYMVYEAIKRFLNPEVVDYRWMLALGILGFIVNSLSVLLLHVDKKENINVKAAYLHLIGDAMTSVAVIAGAIGIWLFNLTWIDPLVTVIISAYIFIHTLSVLKESVQILMQFVPADIEIEKIAPVVKTIDQIKEVYHVHIWQLSDHRIHFEAHVKLKDNLQIADTKSITEKIENLLHDQFRITHVTLQYEYEKCENGNC